MRGLEQTRRTVALSRALDAAGIAHVVVKGIVLSQALYGDVAARASKDIDLLVDPVRMAEAGMAIVALGLERTDPGPHGVGKHSTYVAGPIQVELHNRLVDLPSYAPLDVAALWPRRTRVAMFGHKVPVMGEVGTLLYLCAHGSEHAWFRLKWLQDIARIIVLDADGRVVAAAWRAARAAGFARVLAAPLALVEDVLGIIQAAPPPPPLGGPGACRPLGRARPDRARRVGRARVRTDRRLDPPAIAGRLGIEARLNLPSRAPRRSRRRAARVRSRGGRPLVAA